MTKILGLDVSSTTVGIGVVEIINEEIKFISCSFLKPNKKGSILERLNSTRQDIIKIINQIKPDEIAIEDIIQFMAGNSTAKTIITLTSFNRMIGLLAFDYLHRSPSLFNVMSIRHGLKTDKILPKKEDIPELVANHLQIQFPYLKNKNGKIKTESYDMADSLAVALYSAFLITNRVKRKGKKK